MLISYQPLSFLASGPRRLPVDSSAVFRTALAFSRNLFRPGRYRDRTTTAWTTPDIGVLNRVAAASKNWMESVRLGAAPDESGRRTIEGLSRADAEELLDWLDNQSITDKELILDPAAGFTVRWRAKSQ